MSDPHNVVVSHTPYDGPGVRVARQGDPADMHLGELRELHESIEDSLKKTDRYLQSEETHDLAVAVRGALIGLDTLALHIEQLHRGFERGGINYPETVSDSLSA